MHEYSNIVGYLDLDGCAMFDILPSSFKVREKAKDKRKIEKKKTRTN
jgi:hypothetical protein